MKANTKTATIVVGTTAAVALPEPAVWVESVAYMTEGTASFESLTPTTAAPAGATDIQFTGTPGSPSTALTLDSAPVTAGGLLQVSYAPAGALPSNV